MGESTSSRSRGGSAESAVSPPVTGDAAATPEGTITHGRTGAEIGPTSRRVVIIGGGPVGLTAARFCALRGWHVEVVEQRTDPRVSDIPRNSSFALTLTERGLWPLSRVGLDQKVIDGLSTPLAARVVHPLHGELVPMPYGDRPDHVLHSVARADLHLLLVQNAAELPNVTLHFDHRFVAVDPDEGVVTVEGPKGRREVMADLVIGADGIHSAVRTAIHRGTLASCAKQYLPYRYVEITLDAAAVDLRSLHVWARGDIMCFALPTRSGVTAVCVLPETGPNSLETLQTPEAVHLLFKSEFPDIEANAPRLVEDVLGTPASGFATLRTDVWHRGRVVLAGDAAHAVAPFMGQGVNCGFEDVAILDGMLAKHWADQPSALAAYAEERRPNADALADLSERNFEELRDTVRDPLVGARKQVDLWIQKKLGVPSLYSLVAHSTTPFAECTAREQRRRRIARRAGADVVARGLVVAGSAKRSVRSPRGRAR